MNKIYPVLLFFFVATISLKCQKEISLNNRISDVANNQSSPIISTLQGNIAGENDRPAAGVKISVGSKITTTNSQGYFRIVDAPLDKNASLITAELPGYFEAFRTFRATSGVNQVFIKLTKKILAGTVNTTTGGEVVLSNGAKVSLPANSVAISTTGSAYTGEANVYAAYIDPTSGDISKTIPGSLMADDNDKNRVVLSSYGMLAVELQSLSGEKLQIKNGSAATLTTPIPSSRLSSSPADISLWYVDQTTGIWKQEGSAKKSGNNYVGEVKHFSYWNCDVAVPAIGFTATFKTSNNMVLANLFVTVAASDTASGFAYGITDSLGQVSGLIPSDKSLVLQVRDQCYNIVYTKNIGPFNDKTDLGTIILPATLSSLFIIKGKLLSCSNTPVTKGYALVTLNSVSNHLAVNNKGEFSMSFFSCSGTPATCDILGVDETTNQQGTEHKMQLIQNVTDAGDVNACGTSSLQFISYTLDGTDYTLNPLTDSITAYSWGGFYSTTNTSVSGFHSDNNRLQIFFNGEEQQGIYPMGWLKVNSFDRTKLTQPFDVSLTSFPKNIGEFYEGSFSGSFIDSSALTVTHNINCSFRVKKYY